MAETVNPRLLRIADAFEEMRDFVRAEPALHDFSEATGVLAVIAGKLRRGEPIDVEVRKHEGRIPSRALAVRLLEIVDHAPGPLGHEGPSTIRLFAKLLGQLHTAVVHALLRDHADVVREAAERGAAK